MRNSNLELYRVIVMFLIVAHHYVCHGVSPEIKQTAPIGLSTMMLIFGGWGKVGINCFVLITGYFMCKSRFSAQKLLKLYLQITFYAVLIYGIFCLTGHEHFSPLKLLLNFWPIKKIGTNFIDCFLIFYLFIPVLNNVVSNLSKELHKYMIFLSLFVYSILPLIPTIGVSYNFVIWFMVLYVIASYIRFYGIFPKITHKQWGLMAILLIFIGSASIIGMEFFYRLGYINKFQPYRFVSDSNQILALAIAISSFMFFKDLRIPQSRLINTIGAATFGVLLIHDNSSIMRQWLWHEIVDCEGHMYQSLLLTIGYASISVIIIFVMCVGIDWFRGRYIEPSLLATSEVAIKKLFIS